MDSMQFETLPLFSRPMLSWNLKTDYVGRRFMYRPVSDSTMDDARSGLERFRLGPGAIVLAETQSAARGRNGRSWVSPPDVNLYFTLVMFPELADLRCLPYVTALAVAEAIEEVTAKSGRPLKVDLKWPNDVLIDGKKKVAGILIETTETSEGKLAALIGVGINVNLEVADYPELARIATSLKDALGFKVSREEVLAFFCNHFESLYEEAIAGSNAPFEAWRTRLITLGNEVVATGAAETIRGVAIDVEQDGALVIQSDGQRVRVDAGDVTLSATALD
jgi:BirA family biotin operon repressor/biotin-[acetyl-CoA-carboxylase] ligase